MFNYYIKHYIPLISPSRCSLALPVQVVRRGFSLIHSYLVALRVCSIHLCIRFIRNTQQSLHSLAIRWLSELVVPWVLSACVRLTLDHPRYDKCNFTILFKNLKIVNDCFLFSFKFEQGIKYRNLNKFVSNINYELVTLIKIINLKTDELFLFLYRAMCCYKIELNCGHLR